MRYRFNEFELDTDRFEISKDGKPLQAEPQVIELLALLVENKDRVVVKEEINEVVWRGRIVSEAALSSRIKSLRQLLGDDGKTQQIIRTVHKKGFRFIAEVEPAAPGPAAAPEAAAGDSARRTKRPTVAVLPFANLSSEADQEYLSDGITADIITLLSKHRWLNVVARNTTFGYKGKAPDLQELARDLDASYVVEGSVQRAGERVRISAKLIDAATGHHKWTERYDREMSDIFSLQDEITEMIVARVEPEIGWAERTRVVQARPTNLEAWDCYHLGIHHFFKFTAEDNREAQRLLLESQALDPNFGESYAWWSYAVILGMVYWDTQPSEELLDQALAACDRALMLDHQNASFHALKARVLLARCEYSSAVLENEIAISLNPSLASAYCGLGDSLAYEGQYEDSVRCFERAIALSPNDPQLWAFYSYGALVLLFKQDYEKALEWTERAFAIPNCQYWATAHRAVILAHLGRVDEARGMKERLLRESPLFSRAFAREKLFYLKRPEQIELYLKGLEIAGVPEG